MTNHHKDLNWCDFTQIWNITTGTFKCKSQFIQNENFLVKICWCTHCTCIKIFEPFFFFWQLQTHINHSCYINAQSLLISLAEIDNVCPKFEVYPLYIVTHTCPYNRHAFNITNKQSLSINMLTIKNHLHFT